MVLWSRTLKLDAAAERPLVIGAIDPDVANLRFHAEGVEQAMVIVGIAVGLVGSEVQAIRAFDEIELVHREGDVAVAVDLRRLKFLEIGIGAVNADVVRIEQPEAEHEVGDLLLRRHVHADLDWFTALKDVADLAIRSGDHDAGDLDLAGAPSPLVGLEPVLRA